MAKRKGRNRKRKGHYAKQRPQQQAVLYGGLALVLLAALGLIVYSQLNAPPEVAEARLQTEAVLGAPGAPVQIVEYGAYGCPACRSVHESGILESIMMRYDGSVQFIFRNFPVIHPNDPSAAEAAQCALDQSDDAFWMMHNALFDLPIGEYARAGDNEFITMANELGLDGDAMSLCLSERTHSRTVDHWLSESRRAYVRGTPTFFVNGRLAGSAAGLEAAVVQALNQ